MMLLGISGLGGGLGDAYSDCLDVCDQVYMQGSNPDPDAYGNCTSNCAVQQASTANSTTTSSSPTAAANTGGSFWSTALTSLVKGATQAVVGTPGACPPGSVGTYPACQCLPGSPGVYPTCMTPAQPFYETPFGIAVIIGVLGFGAYMISRR